MKCFVFTFKLCFCCFNFVSLCHVLRPFGNLCQDPVACGRCSENRLEFSISWDWFIIDRMIAKLWHQAAKASLASGEKVCLPPVEFRKGAKICLKFTDVNHEGVIPLKHFWIKKKKATCGCVWECNVWFGWFLFLFTCGHTSRWLIQGRKRLPGFFLIALNQAGFLGLDVWVFCLSRLFSLISESDNKVVISKKKSIQHS